MTNIDKGLSLLCCLLIAMGCAETSVIGDDFIGDENFTVSTIDTLSLEMSTIKFDSIATSGTNRLLLGNYTNAVTGTITSSAYFQLSLGSEFPSVPDESSEFDSLTLILPMDGYFNYLDENGQRLTIYVVQMGEELEYGDDGLLYNISEPFDTIVEVPLASKEFFIDRDRMDDLEIRLDDDFGQDLFDLLLDDDEIFFDSEEFRQYVKAFGISFLGDSASFIGFQVDSIRMRIHASNPNVIPPTEITYDFGVEDSPYYSKVAHTNLPFGFDSLQTIDDEILSDDSNDVSLINGGSGYAVIVDLESVRNLLLDGDDFILASAELRLYWLDSDQEDMPERLQANYVDESFIDVAGETFFFELFDDDQFDRENYYTLDISSLVNALLEPLTIDDYNLLITLEDFNANIASVVLGDQSLESELIIQTITNN